jgi:selenocysteine-specific elongation factor
MHVLGTAGHVDHGKSALVKALSGIDPDRLPEEQARGLTIDLGFAWFETEAGPLGVVDVPGHERFVRTMVAGVGGIDIVLLVIAADDGWMPQTQEHLDILRLLDVRTGVIALSKIDLADAGWADLVEQEIREKTQGTFLQDAPIVRTDALAGTGLDELKNALAAAQRVTSERLDFGRGRLAIDRVFTMTGQGTVVTGTLRDGPFTVDQDVILFPGDRRIRVRGLQTHQRPRKRARPGSRVAVNLTGVQKSEVHRGDWLFMERPVALPRFVGVELEILTNVPVRLRPGLPVLVVFGTTEVTARLVLPGTGSLTPGRKAVAQLDLRAPLSARFGDRFILRLPTPQMTVGGGRFLFPRARRLRRKDQPMWAQLAQIAAGDATDWMAACIGSEKFVSRDRLAHFYPRSREELETALRAGHDAGRWYYVGGPVCDLAEMKRIREQTGELLDDFHKRSPTLPGAPLAEIVEALSIPEETLDHLLPQLESSGIVRDGPYLRRSSHKAALTTGQSGLAKQWRARFAKRPFAGPTRAELIDQSTDTRSALEFMLNSGELTELRDGILLRTEDLQRAARLIVQAIAKEGGITVGRVRDLLGTTRKYVVPVLDRLDRLGYTRREGDERLRGPRADDL